MRALVVGPAEAAGLADNDRLSGIAAIAGGAAVAGHGITLFNQGIHRWLRQQWTRMTADPDHRQTNDAE
jgi:hypothetical protein